MKWELDDLCPISVLAEELGEAGNTVHNWTKRYEDFPKALIDVGRSPLFSFDEVMDWYKWRFPERARRKGLFDALEEDKSWGIQNGSRRLHQEHEAVRGAEEEGGEQEEGSTHCQLEKEVQLKSEATGELYPWHVAGSLPPGWYGCGINVEEDK